MSNTIVYLMNCGSLTENVHAETIIPKETMAATLLLYRNLGCVPVLLVYSNYEFDKT